jgi:hypothetical protein
MHTEGGGKGGGGYETAPLPPRQIFEKFVNKNAIKPKIGGPPQAIFPENNSKRFINENLNYFSLIILNFYRSGKLDRLNKTK